LFFKANHRAIGGKRKAPPERGSRLNIENPISVYVDVAAISREVEIEICLVGIRNRDAVVRDIWFTIAVPIWITEISNPIGIGIFLHRVFVRRAIITGDVMRLSDRICLAKLPR
jgi:hypothetical protein